MASRAAPTSLLASLLLALQIFAPPLLACGRGTQERPWPVLLLTADTLRPDYLSLNGQPLPTTPYLDSLLEEGVYFEQAITPVARTTPALASLLTGAYPHRTGVRDLTDSLSPEVIPIAEVLRERGYQTLAVVTNQVLGRPRRLDRGFEVYDAASDARTASATTDAALRYIDALDPQRPAFVWVHYIDPHVPYHPPPEWAERFDPGYRGRYQLNFGWQPRAGEPPSLHRAFPEDLPKGEATHRNPLPERVNEHIRRLYAGDVRSMDDELERLVTRLQELYHGRLLVVFTADHGESLGEHDFYFDHGDYVSNAETRVPLAFVLPQQHARHATGRRTGFVSLVDVVPTLLDLLDIPHSPALDAQLEGRSLAGSIAGKPLEELPVFAESGHSYYPDLVHGLVRNDVAGRFRAVFLGHDKLIWTPFAKASQAWQYYRVDDDPNETHDLAAANAPQVAQLRHHLDTWLARAGHEKRATSLDPQDEAALRALGYLN